MQSLQMKTVIKLNFYLVDQDSAQLGTALSLLLHLVPFCHRLSYHPSGQHSHADADAEQAQGQNPHFGIHWLNIK